MAITLSQKQAALKEVQAALKQAAKNSSIAPELIQKYMYF